MRVYLASPNNQAQANAAMGMPILFSFACYSKWLDQYQQSFSRILIDSGAYSAYTTGKKIDVLEYRDWADRWIGHADAIAGLDDISGDWRQSLKNYETVGFPTYHDSDPPELLDELIEISRRRGGWLGVGLTKPRSGKEKWIRAAMDRIPDDIHVHGWALRLYTNVRRMDSVDSTNWWRDAMKIRVRADLSYLTMSECLEITVKRYKRWQRVIVDPKTKTQGGFDW